MKFLVLQSFKLLILKLSLLSYLCYPKFSWTRKRKKRIVFSKDHEFSSFSCSFSSHSCFGSSNFCPCFHTTKLELPEDVITSGCCLAVTCMLPYLEEPLSCLDDTEGLHEFAAFARGMLLITDLRDLSTLLMNLIYAT